MFTPRAEGIYEAGYYLSIGYVEVSFGGFVPLNTSNYAMMKHELNLTWDNTKFLAIF